MSDRKQCKYLTEKEYKNFVHKNKQLTESTAGLYTVYKHPTENITRFYYKTVQAVIVD